MGKKVLILGGGIAGMSAALDCGNAGLEVYLLEKEKEIGGRAAHYACKAGDRCQKCSACLVPQFKHKVEHHPNVSILPYSVFTDLQGVPGSFRASVRLLNETRLDLGAETTLDVQAVIVATGFSLYDPVARGELGYGVYRNVVTAQELELALRTFSDLSAAFGEVLDKIGFVQCVGSRDVGSGHNYCSQICCSYAVKLAQKLHYLLPQTEIALFYQDRQTFGKGPGVFWHELSASTHIRSIRGLPAMIFRHPQSHLMVRYTDTTCGTVHEEGFNLVVLCPAVIPGPDDTEAVRRLQLELDQDGFYLEKDIGVSSREGIFLAGACQGPKDIPQSIAHAKAAVGKLLFYLS